MRMASLTFAVILGISVTAARSSEIELDQGSEWNAGTRLAFYKADQGSRIMPYRWLVSLNQKNGAPFLADSLKRYGYLEYPGDQANLPVGFTLTGPAGAQTVGMTCAACHTRQLAVGDQLYRVDGGPALVDFQSFLEDLDEALEEVLTDEVRFKTFAEAVFLPATVSPSDIDALKTRVSAWHLRYHTLIERSLRQPGQDRWGLGRLDAVAMIFNRVTGLGIGPAPTFLIPENIKPADAPVRYPFLWNAPKQDFTQWAGFAENGSAILALSRNVGQVLGVFGAFQPRKFGPFVDFLNGNSVNFNGLAVIEDLVKKIGAPKWPWPVDAALVTRGQAIFNRSPEAGGCVRCHNTDAGLVRFPNEQTWRTPVQNVGTDTRQYRILARTAKSGVLENVSIPSATEPLLETDAALNILKTSVVGSIAQHSLSFSGGTESIADVSSGGTESVPDQGAKRLPPNLRVLENSIRFERAGVAMTEGAGSLAYGSYESRAMMGIWAAAPYLHNGSVPSLAELLVAPAQRVKMFKVGPQYDAENVGLAKTQPASAKDYNATDCSALDSGNSNCGHDFGTQLSGDEKRALLEYLKTL